MFAGFDRIYYPGDDIMDWLWMNTNFYWCGFYLAPAPSQNYTGWMGKRSFLTQRGWGLAPVYVGQQQKGRGSHDVSGDRGRFDGLDAVWLARSAGFPGMSVLYLDIEGAPPFHQSMLDYYQTWVETVAFFGYWPGAYCSSGLAAKLHAINDRSKFWVAHWKQIPFTGSEYPTPDPAQSGYPLADVWQHKGDTNITGPKGRLHRYDLDSSSSEDPSSPI